MTQDIMHFISLREHHLFEECQGPQTVGLLYPPPQGLRLEDVVQEEDEPLQEGEHREGHHESPHVEDLAHADARGQDEHHGLDAALGEEQVLLLRPPHGHLALKGGGGCM